jgi:hypothetical protein
VTVPRYLIHFNQQWVGDHSDEWFQSRGPLARAVVAEMESAGVVVFAGGLIEEIDEAVHADPTGGEIAFSNGPFNRDTEFVGGLTVIDVADDEAAKMWTGRVAEACGWPQEVRRFKA